jgi:hypothetical protein
LIAVISSGGASVTDFDVSGDRFFALSSYCRGWDRFIITDVSDPGNPGPALGSHPIYGSAGRIAASENIVVVTTDDGLLVFDVADPSAPVEVGFLDSPWAPSDLEVENGIAYVALPDEGLRIIDLSDPTNPTVAGSWETSWKSHDLEVDDGIVYVADGAGGLRVIDATNPADPTEVSVLETSEEVLDVSVDGSIATVGLGTRGVLSVDVSDPATLTKTGFFVTDGPVKDSEMQGGTALAVIGSSELTEVGEFLVLDVSMPEEPTDLASFEFSSSSMDVVVAGSVTYIANGETGLYVVDESNPNERVEEFLDTPGFAVSVTLHEQYALVADDHKGVRIIDVSDIRNLVEVGCVDTPGQARNVAVLGDNAYVADGDGGLRIIEFSNPEEPVEIGAIDTPDPAVDVAVLDDYAYVAAHYLLVFDVSDPAHPVAMDISEEIYTRSIDLEEQLLYLVSNYIRILDLSNPREPQPLSEMSWRARTGNEAMNIKVSGHHAYVALRRDSLGRPGGVDVFDVLDPYYPSKVGWWKFEGDGWGVAESNGHTYLAAGQQGLVILDNRCLTTYWLGAVAHSNGLHGSEWRSDVVVSHSAERRVAFDFVLHTVDGMLTAEASVGTGGQGVFEDIVGLLGYEGKGALEVQADHPVTVTSRIYSETDPGTYGAFLQAHRSSDCFGSGMLYGLRQVEGEFRTNISVTNTTDETREVGITLYRTDGLELIDYSIEVPPKMLVQDLQPFKHRAGQPILGWGFATVSGGEGILAFASVIDSRTNDALIVPLTK